MRRLSVGTILKKLNACKEWQKWGRKYKMDLRAAFKDALAGKGPTDTDVRRWLCTNLNDDGLGYCFCGPIEKREKITVDFVLKRLTATRKMEGW